MRIDWRRNLVVGGMAALLATTVGSVWAASPSVEDALKLAPVQKGVAYDLPTAEDAARSTIKAEKIDGKTGWVVRDPAGQMLRMFVDTNGDNVVDRWSYYLDGVEVYRDIDANFNGKADQYRWLNTAGGRWALDANEDGQIDSWKSISAEEVTAELLLTADEASALGLGEEKTKELAAKLKSAAADFTKLAATQKTIGPKSRWIHFGGTRPGVFPAGSGGSTADVMAHENVLAMFETEGKQGQLQVGTLVRSGDVWRLIAAPVSVDEGQAELADAGGFFFRSQAAALPEAGDVPGAPTQEIQKLLSDLETLDKAVDSATTTQAQNEYNTRRADLLEKIAEASKSPAEREQWLRQMVDTIVVAMQQGTYASGGDRLKALQDKLSQDEANHNLTGFVKLRLVMLNYAQALRSEKLDYPKVQKELIEGLEQYVRDYPNSPDVADVSAELAREYEFAGRDDDAVKAYAGIVEKHPDAAVAKKAAGARARLESVGKPLDLGGTTSTGAKRGVQDFRGKALLVYYWSTEMPNISDLAVLKELHARYGKGFAILGVSLDNNKATLDGFLKKNRLPWDQIWEPGGHDSRPAIELGIMSLPTALLLDGQGRVINRNIHVSEVEAELKKILK
jgi:tetratricopeptide (TPR) repeat protein